MPGVQVTKGSDHASEVLTPEALDFVAQLHRSFNPRRLRLLGERRERQARFDAGELPDFLPNTRHVRDDPELDASRRGPAGPGRSAGGDHRTRRAEDDDQRPQLRREASSWRDFEDALSPTWDNVVTGQWAVAEAVPTPPDPPDRREDLRPERGSGWPRSSSGRVAGTWTRATCWWTAPPSRPACSTSGWSSSTTRANSCDADRVPTSTCRSSSRTSRRSSGTTSSSPPRKASSIPQGSIRATVLIETILAAFEMEEILYELRDHAAGLNAGRWDYIFSMIKKLRSRPEHDPAGSRPGHHGRSVHARLSAAAGHDLPSARRARDRRHERLHPESPRAGGDGASAGRRARGQAARVGRRFGRHLGRAPGPRAGGGRDLRRGARDRPNQKDRSPGAAPVGRASC